jgi:hypothetical protein
MNPTPLRVPVMLGREIKLVPNVDEVIRQKMAEQSPR